MDCFGSRALSVFVLVAFGCCVLGLACASDEPPTGRVLLVAIDGASSRVIDPLLEAGRSDLIGSGRRCLIPAEPPSAAIEARRRAANAEGATYVHAEDAGTRPQTGYRRSARSRGRQRQRRD